MARLLRKLLPVAAIAALIIATLVGTVAHGQSRGNRQQGNRPAGRSGRGGGRNRSPLKVGQMAPDFELALVPVNLPKATTQPATQPTSRPTTRPTAEARMPKVKLSSFRGKLPVVLIFSSYT